jgi:hypothetical protein
LRVSANRWLSQPAQPVGNLSRFISVQQLMDPA